MIFDRFRNFEKLRKQKLSVRKDVFLETLQEPKTMLIIVDPEEKSWREAVSAVETYARKSGVHCTIIYVDQRDDRKLPLPVLSADVVSEDLFEKDGSPMTSFCQGRYDVLISLATGSSYPLEYLVAHTEAKVRIGREALPTAVFDIIVGPTGRSQDEAFADILTYMHKLICKR